MREAIARFWTEREERERAAIAFTLIVAAFALAYVYVWLPVTRERDRLLVRVPELRAEVEAMERDGREVGRAKVLAGAPVELRSAVRQASAKSMVPDTALEMIQSDHPARVRVVVASASSQQALAWLGRLQSARGIRIETARLNFLGETGGIKVDVVLREAP